MKPHSWDEWGSSLIVKKLVARLIGRLFILDLFGDIKNHDGERLEKTAEILRKPLGNSEDLRGRESQVRR